MIIRPDETEIRGSWIRRGKMLEADDNCRRIEYLLANCLEEIGRDASGWNALYRDPADDRYWELSYPQSEMHGGGPPLLKCLAPEEARAKYDVP